MVKEKRYACATERFSQRTLSPLCCISFRFWSEGASWRNIMAIKLVKSHACLFCNAILWVLWKGILGIKWSHTPYLKLLFSMISLAYCAHSFLHCFFFFYSILEYWILIGLVFVIIIVYSSWNEIRNWCQYTVQKTISCQTQNGTETVVQRLFQSCRWPGPCSNLIRYREKKWSHGICWIMLLLFSLTLTWTTTNRLGVCFASLYFPSYRTLVRPVYRVTYRKITSLEWRCCPGFHGEDCREGEGAHFSPISNSLKY